MDILSALSGEHGPLRHLLDALRLSSPQLSAGELRAATLLAAEAIESHAKLEDELLFEPLAASGRMPDGPVEAMRAEHARIESLFGQLLAPADEPGRPDPQRTVGLLVETVRHHFSHEENALFPLAAGALGPGLRADLGARWARQRGVEVAFSRSAPACRLPTFQD